MIKVIPFAQEHLEKIQCKAVHGQCPKTVMNTAFTFMSSNRPIAIFGGFVFVPGVIHFWGIVSDDVRFAPLEFHKKVLEVLRWYEETEKPRRIQVDVDCNYPEGIRWAEALGFKREGILKAYGPEGQDYYLYGRGA